MTAKFVKVVGTYSCRNTEGKHCYIIIIIIIIIIIANCNWVVTRWQYRQNKQKSKKVKSSRYRPKVA
jgi:flagellar basal body-associated protein FliL